MADSPSPLPHRTVDMASLKALAHPLRVQILETIFRYGPQTAGTLAERLGESTGSTSYHLRQLAKYDFVLEVEGHGTKRERWWDRPKGMLTVVTRELAHDPATREAAQLVRREFDRSRAAALDDFIDRSWSDEPAEWSEAATVSTTNVRLTVEQLAELSRAAEEFIAQAVEKLRAAGVQEGARPVQIHLNAFPLADDHPTPRAEAPEN
ncbi:helix-turn-helix domain-containing protein [Sinomonas sp. ASV322]|uniref:helix-turn-helix domain-containing protein n=1 Tax=Sinomonas sp. ASV322 TaxID=3041920 RepID=UPI0027DBBFC7|nr:helix-turn-helix domain-containing protein [Sinomonas sp. ASV322]MDQ4501962.1 helix-turn-helix domain-containing protein [Sinomonas sp. ASV322]